jgi:hypothetical protein
MEETDIRISILRFLSKNPEAKDTLEGMLWWVMLDQCEVGIHQVRKVAVRLVREGLLTSKRIGSQGPVYYTLNRARLSDIWAIVQPDRSPAMDGN